MVPLTSAPTTHAATPVVSPLPSVVEPRPSSKAPWIAAVAAAVAIVAGVGVYLAVRSDDSAPKGAAFPQQVRENFLTSCGESSGGNAPYCDCVLTQFEQQYSVDEFLALEQRFVNGTGEDELDAVVAPCLSLLSP